MDKSVERVAVMSQQWPCPPALWRLWEKTQAVLQVIILLRLKLNFSPRLDTNLDLMNNPVHIVTSVVQDEPRCLPLCQPLVIILQYPLPRGLTIPTRLVRLANRNLSSVVRMLINHFCRVENSLNQPSIKQDCEKMVYKHLQVPPPLGHLLMINCRCLHLQNLIDRMFHWNRSHLYQNCMDVTLMMTLPSSYPRTTARLAPPLHFLLYHTQSASSHTHHMT